MLRRPLESTLFPYTTLFRSVLVKDIEPGPDGSYPDELTAVGSTLFFTAYDSPAGPELWKSDGTDRKSTRLNSSHSQISYAVFCLKKKKTYSSDPAIRRSC